MAECPFCRDLAAQRDVVGEDDYFFMRWDKYPVAAGHLLIIPKRHVTAMSDLSREERERLATAVTAGMELVRTKVQPDGFNIGINEGIAAGQTVKHLHVHVIPRREGDVDDPAGGVRGVIPGKRRY